MLSPTQRRMLIHIARVIQSTGQSPTIAELQQQFGMRSPASIHQNLVLLEREGVIRRTPHISRGIEIVRQV